MPTTQVLSAATSEGRDAIATVMARSYRADVDSVPPEWALARVVDGVPVSFILVDPDRAMQFPEGDVRYAFICDVATREDRRREGHFRALMEFTFEHLRAAGIPLVLTHGRYPLYRRFDFDVFTHHSSIFITPEQITHHLGQGKVDDVASRLTIFDHRALLEDLLVVKRVPDACIQAGPDAVPLAIEVLQAAATLARERGKTRILFEYPPAPSYGSAYPLYAAIETPFVALARTCGAQVCVQGADPECGTVPDADWIKVLDVLAFLRDVLACLPIPAGLSLRVTFETDAGTATLLGGAGTVTITPEPVEEAARVRWPATALAQLVTGYRSAALLDACHGPHLDEATLSALNRLFPPGWRFSRNESWVFRE